MAEITSGVPKSRRVTRSRAGDTDRQPRLVDTGTASPSTLAGAPPEPAATPTHDPELGERSPTPVEVPELARFDPSRRATKVVDLSTDSQGRSRQHQTKVLESAISDAITAAAAYAAEVPEAVAPGPAGSAPASTLSPIGNADHGLPASVPTSHSRAASPRRTLVARRFLIGVALVLSVLVTASVGPPVAISAAPALTVGANSDGHLELFATRGDGSVWHAWQVYAGGPWSDWKQLLDGATSAAVVGREADGRLELFTRSANGRILHRTQTPSHRDWNATESLGGAALGSPAVGITADGRQQLFVRGVDGRLDHAGQTAANGGWSDWEVIGPNLSIVSDPVVAADKDGRLEVFATARDGTVWHAWMLPGRADWSAPQSMGTPLSGSAAVTGTPAVVPNQDGRLEIFARLGNGLVVHAWQVSPNSWWSPWASLPGAMATSDVAAGDSRPSGRIEIFARGPGGAVWHTWQTAANSPFAVVSDAGQISRGAPLVASDHDGRLELFVQRADGEVWNTWQTAPDGPWAPWAQTGIQSPSDG